ncbi:MAG: prolyl-tRNA editing enzyme YbaK/EbsC (Cys-tRNA(Pro) deacylase) [Candidatus Poriferisodalaceae bacterium]|jgi:prolyl-tRNA editing enzyme YbaK/EbsC (Cys-tRNA(Pro) deacylase)|tara:strand:+ start:4542 stop:5015 length:474 start_codon:yes stop_codon:yes gene_type:complete
MAQRMGANIRFVHAVRAAGLEPVIQNLAKDTRTAIEAASVLGCELEQIVKSLVFVCGENFLLVLTAGSNKVNESKLSEVMGEPVERASPTQVREATGYAIGGVPPIGHTKKLKCLFDPLLLSNETVYGAAGTPSSVFAISSSTLLDLTAGSIEQFTE